MSNAHDSSPGDRSADDASTPEALLPWPPPGLGRIQGDLGAATRKMTLASGILVLPLMGALALPQSPYGLGPLGNAWWVVLVTTLVGVGLFVDAAVFVARMQVRARHALAGGYPLRVVGLVLSDTSRDHGHLLQGAHAFSEVSETERVGLASLRISSSLAYLMASSWFVVGFGILLLFAARGGLTLRGLLLGTLVPTTVLAIAGLALGAVAGTLTRRARRAWHQQPWSQDLAAREIAAWRDAGAERGLLAPAGGGGAPGWMMPLTIGLAAASLLAIFPPATMVPVSSMGAILGSIAGYSWGGTQRRMAEAEAYRSLVLAPDPSVTPAEAGELLHVIALVADGSDTRDPLIRSPARQYDEPWTPENAPEGFNPGDPESWSKVVWEWIDRGLTAEERDFLERAAEHPARGEFSRLAGASELDAVAARFQLPFPDDLTYFALPWINWTPVRAAADTHVALAALHSAAGRHAEAQRVAQEVVSVGILLMDQEPTLIGNFIGARIAKQGGQALASVLRRAGESQQADLLDAAVDGAAAAAARALPPDPRNAWATNSSLLAMPGIVLDADRPRGLRWEYAHMMPVISACLNVRRVVFGPPEEQRVWADSARVSLVRFDSESELFDLAMNGMTPFGEPGLVGRALAFAMGGAEDPASCGHVVRYLPSSME